MAHALLDPEYHRKIAEWIRLRAQRPALRVLVAPAVEELPFEDITEGDIVRHCGEDHQVIEISHQDGWMVVMDERDHCDAVMDCKGQTFTRVEGLF